MLRCDTKRISQRMHSSNDTLKHWTTAVCVSVFAVFFLLFDNRFLLLSISIECNTCYTYRYAARCMLSVVHIYPSFMVASAVAMRCGEIRAHSNV